MPHRCFNCDPGNPERVFRYDGDAAVARFPARFCGPPGDANGGIAVGALACPALHAADAAPGGVTRRVGRIVARLRLPVPLQRDLAVATQPTEDGGWRVSLSDDESELISGTVSLVAPPALADDRARVLDEMAGVAVPDAPPFYELTGDHPIPRCFSCGPEHEAGLHIIPRSVRDGVIASAWRAAGAFGDGEAPRRALSPMIVAAALDCSSGICMPVAAQQELLADDLFFLLGTLDVRFLQPVPTDGAYRVVGRALARDGRKFFGMSALFDAGAPGALYATAEAVWIVAPVTRTAAFGPA